VRTHFIHHNQASYFVIPNLYSCTKEETAKAVAMNQLAGILSDLQLVIWPSKGPEGRVKAWWRSRKSELERLKLEEDVASNTDLSEIKRKWKEGPDSGAAPSDQPLRNHGLFSKAERALEHAEWSEQARRDVEIFRLVDAEGLTPLLMVLDEPGGERPAGQPA
jgi:hypothetical protein